MNIELFLDISGKSLDQRKEETIAMIVRASKYNKEFMKKVEEAEEVLEGMRGK